MTNRSKKIGTRAESGVVHYARSYGYPFADRQPLRGSKDCGDVTFSPGFIGEVKAGRKAWDASDNQIITWLEETIRERDSAGADLGVLVVARYRQPVERWWAVMSSLSLAPLVAYEGLPYGPDVSVRLTLRNALTLTRWAGYGDPLTPLPDEAVS